MGRHLTDPDRAPPVKAVFIYNHNPVVVHPEQNRMRRGLAREDLFSHFEHDDLSAAYGQRWHARARAPNTRSVSAEHSTEADRPPFT